MCFRTVLISSMLAPHARRLRVKACFSSSEMFAAGWGSKRGASAGDEREYQVSFPGRFEKVEDLSRAGHPVRVRNRVAGFGDRRDGKIGRKTVFDIEQPRRHPGAEDLLERLRHGGARLAAADEGNPVETVEIERDPPFMIPSRMQPVSFEPDECPDGLERIDRFDGGSENIPDIRTELFEHFFLHRLLPCLNNGRIEALPALSVGTIPSLFASSPWFTKQIGFDSP
jgi:hypothetical protein